MSQIEIAHRLLANTELFLGYQPNDGMLLCSDWSRLGLPTPDKDDLRVGVPFNSVVEHILGRVTDETRERVLDKIRLAWGEGFPLDIEFYAAHTNGEVRRLRLVDVLTESGDGTRWMKVCDVHDERSREDQIDELAIAVENAMQGISKLDRDGVFVEVRPAYAEMLGYDSPEELVGKCWTTTVADRDISTGEATYRQMLETGKGESVITGLRRDGSEFDKQLLLVKRHDRDGHFVGHFCFMRDVSTERALQRKLEHEAGHDHLTALINRRQFEERLSSAIATARRNGGQHVVIYIDLDQFKVINDTLGHVAGDHLLTKLAAELAKIVRARDTLARLGGDEFAILAEHCSVDDGVRIADALRRTVSDFETHWEGIPLKVGASIGIAAVGVEEASANEILKRADSACYIAKELGRNRTYVYGETDDEIHQRNEQMQWISRIHEALKTDGFAVYAQPIKQKGQAAARHFETLIRLALSDGTASPGAFLPAAEKYNVATKVDRWMVERVFALLADNPDWTQAMEWISINLSAQTVGCIEFRAAVPELVERFGIDPRKICFELTETAAVTRLPAARELISTFRSLGFHFALDDFGAGASSFGYLQQLDVDYIKIDGSIVQNVERDEASAVMIEAIARIAQIRGMRCIAEFVECERVAEVLSSYGVEFLQGYLYGAPRPAQELADAITERDRKLRRVG